MGLMAEVRGLNASQRNAFLACFLGWALDAFDFFILTFCLKAIAADFHVALKEVSIAVSLTLMMRPLGALVFGVMAEKIGRRPALMWNILAFSVFELASAFAPSLRALLICRALFGIAMGGEWGVGAALALESLPAKGRGFFSGVLQEGYSIGNLLAAATFGLVFSHLPVTGVFTNWRVMFMIGAAPALLVFYVRRKVEESPAWLKAKAEGHKQNGERVERIERIAPGSLAALRGHWGRFFLLVVLMFAFMSLSHGTQDLYPAFLQGDHHFDSHLTGLMGTISSFGAVVGGMFWGGLSERIGRRRGIIFSTLLTLPLIPLWLWSHQVVAVACGGFLMQFMVQGAWGIVPAHLNELSPGAVRAVMPGLVYQLGALLSSWNIVFQTGLAAKYAHGALTPVLGGTVVLVAVVQSAMTAVCGEQRGVEFGGETGNTPERAAV